GKQALLFPLSNIIYLTSFILGEIEMRLKNSLIRRIKQGAIPRHVAIIMDDNGRWAQKKGLPKTEGHRHGVETLRDIIKISDQLGIKYLTLYAFSTENWKRPRTEIEAIMSLLVEYLETELEELDRNKVKIVILGDTSVLSERVQNAIS